MKEQKRGKNKYKVYFLEKVKGNLVRSREFDEKSYPKYNINIPIRMTVVNIILSFYYLGQYMENAFFRN